VFLSYVCDIGRSVRGKVQNEKWMKSDHLPLSWWARQSDSFECFVISCMWDECLDQKIIIAFGVHTNPNGLAGRFGALENRCIFSDLC